MLKSDLFHHQGNLPNNFTTTMQNTRNALQAIGMFKDEYLLDFINVEELGVRDEADIDERVVENAIVHNVKNFIMTFGRDFTFVGNQYHLEKFGHDEYPDFHFVIRFFVAEAASVDAERFGRRYSHAVLPLHKAVLPLRPDAGCANLLIFV